MRGLLFDAVYLLAGLLLSPWLVFKVLTDRRYRHRLGERFGRLPERGEAPVLWVHGSSVGEVNVVRPLVARFREAHPEYEVLVTAVTMAGLERAAQAFPGARTAYMPLDFGFAVRRALRRVRPAGVILVELEVWPNFVRTCRRRSVPVVVVNGRISHRSARRYRRLRGLLGGSFRRLAGVGAQNETYAARFRDMGIDAEVTGNLKFDAAIDLDPDRAGAEVRAGLQLGDAPVLVAGSTHDPEERVLVETYRQLRERHPGLRFVLAPRHVHRVEEVEKVIAASGLRCYKKSQLPPGADTDAVIVLDTVGELARVYAAATAVFIGGTFCNRGGQNMLEPAVLGKPIVSGPDVSNFADIARVLVEAGGMRILDNPVELGRALSELIGDPDRARRAGAKGREAVTSGRGALEATLRMVESKLLKGT